MRPSTLIRKSALYFGLGVACTLLVAVLATWRSIVVGADVGVTVGINTVSEFQLWRRSARDGHSPGSGERGLDERSSGLGWQLLVGLGRPDESEGGSFVVVRRAGWPFVALTGEMLGDRDYPRGALLTHGIEFQASALNKDRWNFLPTRPILLGFTADSVVFGLGCASLALVLRTIISHARRRVGRCTRCGYLLAGSRRCSECGSVVDKAACPTASA